MPNIRKTDKLQEFLDFFGNQKQPFDIEYYNKGLKELEKKYSLNNEYLDILKLFKTRKPPLIEYVGPPYRFDLTKDGQDFIDSGGFIGEEKRKEDSLKLADDNTKLQAQLFPLLIDANKSTIITNENTRNTNKILIIVFVITAFMATVSAIVSIHNVINDSEKSILRQQIKYKDSLLLLRNKQ